MIDDISQALGSMQSDIKHLLYRQTSFEAKHEARDTVLETKIEALMVRDRDFKTALRVGSKVTHFFMAAIGGVVVWIANVAFHYLK